jgi:hypothetical protein
VVDKVPTEPQPSLKSASLSPSDQELFGSNLNFKEIGTAARMACAQSTHLSVWEIVGEPKVRIDEDDCGQKKRLKWRRTAK